jgi:hypothetical protein
VNTATAYKWLNGRDAIYVHGVRYRLGQWRTARGPLFPCQNGIHLCRVEHLSRWIDRDLYVAEYDGDVLDAGDKIIARRARIVEHLRGWNERTARLAAADFAEEVLHLWEERFPDDDRPRRAIEAARQLARGEIDEKIADAAAYAAYAAYSDACELLDIVAELLDIVAYAIAYAAYSRTRDSAYSAHTAASTSPPAYVAYTAANAAANAEDVADDVYIRQGEIILDYAYGRRS